MRGASPDDLGEGNEADANQQRSFQPKAVDGSAGGDSHKEIDELPGAQHQAHARSGHVQVSENGRNQRRKRGADHAKGAVD